MNKPQIHRCTLYLHDRTYITPNYIRLTFKGNKKDIGRFVRCTIGANNKIFIPPQDVEKVYFPDESEDVDPVLIATRRTFTHAGLSITEGEMYMEFVAHGTEGPASDFAINAVHGSPLGVAMKLKSSPLIPDAEQYIIAGDSTAIPVIKAIINSLKDHQKAEVFLEIPTEEDKQNIGIQENINIHWLINPNSGQNTNLAEKVIQSVNTMDIPEDHFAFVACEYSNVRKLREYFRKEKEWPNTALNAYSYWKYGEAETKSESTRRAEKQSN